MAKTKAPSNVLSFERRDLASRLLTYLGPLIESAPPGTTAGDLQGVVESALAVWNLHIMQRPAWQGNTPRAFASEHPVVLMLQDNLGELIDTLFPTETRIVGKWTLDLRSNPKGVLTCEEILPLQGSGLEVFGGKVLMDPPAKRSAAKPAARSTALASRVLRIKVTLNGIKPPIWRRLLVKANTTLADLHMILQVTMGWSDSHLHEFEWNGELYGESEPEWDQYRRNEHKTKLGNLLTEPGDRLTYHYDFGDSWKHNVVLEAVLKAERGQQYPWIEKGKRACPLEDSGGPWGYQEKLEILRNPKHPEYSDIRDWVPEDFDPDSFDLDESNDILTAFLEMQRQED